jgi:hypothetical protein
MSTAREAMGMGYGLWAMHYDSKILLILSAEKDLIWLPPRVVPIALVLTE